MGNPTPGIQWYNFRPHGVTHNRGMGPPVRRFLSNYFDLLLAKPKQGFTIHTTLTSGTATAVLSVPMAPPRVVGREVYNLIEHCVCDLLFEFVGFGGLPLRWVMFVGSSS